MGQLYQETFDAGRKKDVPLETIGWRANAGLNGGYVPDNDLTQGVWLAGQSGASGGQGYIFNQAKVLKNEPFFVWSTISGPSLQEAATVTFFLSNSNAEENIRFALRINEQWYVTDATYNGRGAQEKGAWAQQTINIGATAWRKLIFQADKELALGEAAALPAEGKIEAVGFFDEQVQSAIRIDDLSILAEGQTVTSVPKIEGDPAMEPQPVDLNPGPQYADDKRIFQGIPGIERSPAGRLWAAWYSGGKNEGVDNYVLLASSDDQGKSWSEPTLVIDPPGLVRAYDPCLWTDPQGRLWFFWAQSAGWWDGRAGVWAIVSENPDAPNPTWSAPRRLADGIMMNKPTVASNGDWLLPSSIWPRGVKADTPPEVAKDFSKISAANVYVSKDQGASWTLLGGANIPNRVFDEHMLVEKKNGDLWMLARTRTGIAESFSKDGGKTWSEGQTSSIPHINSRFFVRRLASGNLLMVRHNPPEGVDRSKTSSRSHLTAYLSDDDGVTWKGGVILDERVGISYPDGVQSPDGSILIIYDFDRKGARQILMARFREEDVLAGKLSSEGASERILVNQASGRDSRTAQQ